MLHYHNIYINNIFNEYFSRIEMRNEHDCSNYLNFITKISYNLTQQK